GLQALLLRQQLRLQPRGTQPIALGIDLGGTEDVGEAGRRGDSHGAGLGRIAANFDGVAGHGGADQQQANQGEKANAHLPAPRYGRSWVIATCRSGVTCCRLCITKPSLGSTQYLLVALKPSSGARMSSSMRSRS